MDIFAASPDPRLIYKQGRLICIIRPADPELAVARARGIQERLDAGQIAAEQAGREFAAMITEQVYTYEGLPGSDGTLYDDKMNVIGRVQPGDSFVPYEQVLESFKATPQS